VPSYNYQLFQKNIFKQKNECVTINDIDDTTLYHETVNVQLRLSSDLSDLFKVFEAADICTLWTDTWKFVRMEGDYTRCCIDGM